MPVLCGIKLDSSQGFAHDFVAYCEQCDCEKILFNSSKRSKRTDIVKGKKTPFEVNTRMLSFSRAIGKGHSALETFSKHLNSPPPMTVTNNRKLLKLQHAASKAVATGSMKAAAAEVSEEGMDCAVSVDGTWQRRGHASHHGVVSAIPVDVYALMWKSSPIFVRNVSIGKRQIRLQTSIHIGKQTTSAPTTILALLRRWSQWEQSVYLADLKRHVASDTPIILVMGTQPPSRR